MKQINQYCQSEESSLLRKTEKNYFRKVNEWKKIFKVDMGSSARFLRPVEELLENREQF